MPKWCSTDAVASHLKGIQGANYDTNDIGDKIEEARSSLIAQFAGKFSTDTLDAWDLAELAPPEIAAICAKMAAALILESFGDGQFTAVRETKAGSWYADCQSRIKGILANKSYLATASDDNTAVSRTDALLVSSKTSDDRVFTDDTLENFSA